MSASPNTLDLSEAPGAGSCCGLWLADCYDPSELCQAVPDDLSEDVLFMISELRWSKGCVYCPVSLVPDNQRAQFKDLIFVRSGRTCNGFEAILPDTIMADLKQVFPLGTFEHEAALLVFLEENRYQTACGALLDCVLKFPASMLREMLAIKAKRPNEWADEILFKLAIDSIDKILN